MVEAPRTRVPIKVKANADVAAVEIVSIESCNCSNDLVSFISLGNGSKSVCNNRAEAGASYRLSVDTGSKLSKEMSISLVGCNTVTYI